ILPQKNAFSDSTAHALGDRNRVAGLREAWLERFLGYAVLVLARSQRPDNEPAQLVNQPSVRRRTSGLVPCNAGASPVGLCRLKPCNPAPVLRHGHFAGFAPQRARHLRGSTVWTPVRTGRALARLSREFHQQFRILRRCMAVYKGTRRAAAIGMAENGARISNRRISPAQPPRAVRCPY